MDTQTPKQNNDIKDSVLARLKDESVQPRSKMWWQCQECLVWVLWGASILIGALAVAVLIFASMHASYALFEATHDSPFTFIVEVLPYAWVGIFTVMAWLGYRNFRNTKRGYKYPLTHILLSSIVFSVAGGALLHFAGVGYVLDTSLGRLSPMYVSQAEKEQRMWQRPADGRLVGMTESRQASSSVIFIDIDGTTWSVNTEDLHKPDLRTLLTGKQVRVLGIYASTSDRTLHACGVFPWMFDKSMGVDDMKEERQAFIERMYAHKDNQLAREAALHDETFGDRAMGACADMPVVKRIGEMMR